MGGNPSACRLRESGHRRSRADASFVAPQRTGSLRAPSFMPTVEDRLHTEFGWSGCLAVAIALGAIGTARLKRPISDLAPGFYERFAFEAADTDGDGFVSEAELARDAAAGFSGLDKDRQRDPDARRSSGRTIRRCSPASIANGDGVLTFSEVMIHKTQGVRGRRHRTRTACLSFEEMVDEAKSELGVP